MRHQIAFTVSVPSRSGEPPSVVADSVVRGAGILGYGVAEARFSDTYRDNLRIRILSRFEEEKPGPETAELKRFTGGAISDAVHALVPGVRFVSLDSSSWTGHGSRAKEAIRILDEVEAAIRVKKLAGS